MSTKSMSIENNNKESVDRYKEKAKSFTDKIVNKISYIRRGYYWKHLV